MVKDDLSVDLKFLKKIKIEYFFLFIFLIIGFYLRVYHIDFPSIGYHNMKENEYIGEAIFFKEEGDFLHRRTFNFWGLEDGPGYFEEYAQVPFIPYITAFLWKIFGEHIWMPRLFVMLFMLGSIVLIYFIVKKLTNNNYLSLLSSFLLTIMPLGIYFGRNIQPESPAFFFSLLAINFYLDWIETLEKKKLMYSMLAVSIAGLFKFTFLIIGIPILLLVPYEKINLMFKKKRKEFFEQIYYFFLGVLPFIILQSIFELTILDPSKKAGSEAKITDILNLFSSSFWSKTWPTFSSFIADNYTWWFFWFSVLGFIFVLFKYKTKFSKFIISYVIAIPVYLGILSSKIGGHSYYQMPFLHIICILSAYFLFNIGSLLKQILKIKYIEYASLFLILLTISDVQAANDRVWSTIFYGQDVVGEYIKANTLPNERFFNFGHDQDQAVCTYARRRCGAEYNLTKLQELEKKFNIRYMNIDSYSMVNLQQKTDLLEYIQTNYKIKLIGALKVNEQFVPLNFLLEKGGKFNISELSNKTPVVAKVYDTKRGVVPFYIIENK